MWDIARLCVEQRLMAFQILFLFFVKKPPMVSTRFNFYNMGCKLYVFKSFKISLLKPCPGGHHVIYKLKDSKQ
jgi:hypothetical protein